MKVLHVEAGKHLYGGARQVAYILEGLKQRGVENSLVCCEGSDIAQQAQHSAQVHAIKMRGDADILLVLRLLRIIRDVNPDIIHLHSRRGADLWGALAARLSGIPVVLSRRVDNLEPAWWANIKYSLVNHIITISEGISRVLLGENIAADKITCVRSAVDIREHTTECVRSYFQHQFPLSRDKCVIAVIAQLIPRKGHAVLLDALEQLGDSRSHVQCLMFGKGPLRDELQDAINHRGLNDQVILTGFRTDINQLLPCIDIVVHPAFIEGLGIALLQASASGVPVIASRTGGIPEVIHHEHNGLLVEPGNVQQLTEALRRLIEDVSLRQQMGRHGRELAEQEFSIDRMVEGNLAVYNKLLAG